jgi:hypothetical protein
MFFADAEGASENISGLGSYAFQLSIGNLGASSPYCLTFSFLEDYEYEYFTADEMPVEEVETDESKDTTEEVEEEIQTETYVYTNLACSDG